MKLKNFSPLSPVILSATVRSASGVFSYEAFKNALALFLNCSYLQVCDLAVTTCKCHCVVTSSQIIIKSAVAPAAALPLELLNFGAQRSTRSSEHSYSQYLSDAADEVTFMITLSESPFLPANIAPSILSQVLKLAVNNAYIFSQSTIAPNCVLTVHSENSFCFCLQ